ncbi:MAG: TatD family hydrolase [Paramuribaculum sp.]|nr:TatD family hydrolase [Paramuribaculum sp.]MDE6303592.1 TatD family hydrolase [Paramuribaculum sp.]
MVDTHTHPYLPEFDADRDEVVRNAIAAGVEMMILPNVDFSTIQPMKELAARWPENTRMAMGLHPTEVTSSWRDNFGIIESELRGGTPYVAVGEVGMDLYWDKTWREAQMEALDYQMKLATQLGLPVIIHCREALDEVIEVMSGLPEIPPLVMHSFGGTVEDVERLRKYGDFYFGINGIVTFKNSRLREVLPAIGLDRILLETDAPYLAPVPYRGRRNQPAYVVETGREVARSLGVDFDMVKSVTDSSARKFFGIR